MSDVKSTNFTLDELQNELEKYRPRKPQFTSEMDDLLLRARDADPPVSWNNVCKFFKEKFGEDWHRDVWRRRYEELKTSEPNIKRA